MRCACYNIIMAELSVDLPGEPIPNGENAAMITTLTINTVYPTLSSSFSETRLE